MLGAGTPHTTPFHQGLGCTHSVQRHSHSLPADGEARQEGLAQPQVPPCFTDLAWSRAESLPSWAAWATMKKRAFREQQTHQSSQMAPALPASGSAAAPPALLPSPGYARSSR